MAAMTADWSHVSVACVPDDDTLSGMYDATSDGIIRFQGVQIGQIEFWCNVLSPLNALEENPNWSRMYVTFRDTGDGGQLQAQLIQKDKHNGATAILATFTSTNGPGVREEFVAIPNPPGLNFVRYAYFVHIVLKRDASQAQLEFHIVSLKSH